MKKRIASIVLVSAMGVGAVSLTPAFAASGTEASQRLTGIKDALKGLVSDGTITQAQADKVATTLDKDLPRHGRKGHHLLDGAATALGLTVEQLKTAMGTTKSLADVAATKDVSRDALLDKLIAQLSERLAADVTAGRLTQAQADAKKAEARERLGEVVDRKGVPQRGQGRGPGGPGEERAAAPVTGSST